MDGPDTQLPSGLALSHCLIVPAGPCLRLVFCEHPTGRQQGPAGRRGSFRGPAGVAPFAFLSLHLCKAPPRLPQQAPLLNAPLPPSCSEPPFTLAYSLQTRQCAHPRAQLADFFFSSAHTCGANTQVKIQNISTPQEAPSCLLPDTTLPPGCAQRPSVTAEASLECVPVCLTSLIYHEIHRLHAGHHTRQQLLVFIAT